LKKRILHIIFLCSLSLFCQAQQYNNWCFGSAVQLSFNTTPNTIAPDIVTGNVLDSDEGCASISDVNGALLFYTNGKTVYNKLHKIMQNGNGLKGHKSAFQSSAIVPHPGNPNLYYLFTADAFETNFVNGYTYHVIDITKDNGNGEVIVKNNLLDASGTERLYTIQHANGVDIWLITNDNYSNKFKCWLINCSGLQPTPVISTVGEVLNSYPDMNSGAIKVSPDGKTLSQTHFPASDVLNFTHFFQLFDFNNSTGTVSNPKKIILPGRFIYSSEFSPNSKLLYLTDPNRRNLLQVDISLPTIASIVNSLDTIPCGYGLYGIQSAPNNKIFTCRSGRYLGVINNPNVKGLGCTYADSAMYLKGYQAQLNLPNFINNAFADPYNNFTYTTIDSCVGKVQFTAFSNLSGVISYEWNFGDGSTSNVQNPVHTFSPADRQYNVRLKITSSINCGVIYKSAIVAPQGLIVRADFSYVAICDSAIVRFTNTSVSYPNPSNYLWNFGDNTTSTDINPVHSYPNAGSYIIKLTIQTSTPCFASTATKTFQNEVVSLQAPADFTMNEGEVILLTTTSTGTKFTWTPNIDINDVKLLSPTINPIEDITYYVESKNDAGCFANDTVVVKVNSLKDIYIPTVFTPNGDAVNDVLYPTFSRTFKDINFSVYNRWGHLVFKGNMANKFTWDGKYKNKPAEIGVYVWQFSGINKKGVVFKKKGTLLLLK
jgi:gliding motility-associated-like protein